MKDQTHLMSQPKGDDTWMQKTGGFARDKTLRDEFAGQAMQAQLSMSEVCVAIGNGDITIAGLCGSCFEWADAMLKAREGK
jgi:hypothetical protein